MLNVSYVNRIGYYTETQTIGEQTRKYKIWICHANCLCAMMYFYKDEKGEDMVQLCSFLHDIQHLKNCIKNNVYKGCDNYHFKAKQMNSDLWKMVKILAESGKKVTIE